MLHTIQPRKITLSHNIFFSSMGAYVPTWGPNDYFGLNVCFQFRQAMLYDDIIHVCVFAKKSMVLVYEFCYEKVPKFNT